MCKEKQSSEVDIHSVVRGIRDKHRKTKARRPKVALPGDGSISLATARESLPPKAIIRRDEHQKRWQVFMGPRGYDGQMWAKSKSWGVSGDESEAVKFVLAQVWDRYSSLTGVPNPMATT